MVKEYHFSTLTALFDACADAVSNQLVQAINTNGSATMVVSGGSTPKPVYERLAQQNLGWDKVNIKMVDERFVPLSNGSSNEAMLRSSLLPGYGAKASFTGLYNAAANIEEAADIANQYYAHLAKGSDLIILGMGGDGHTASLFPDAKGLDDALSLTTDRVVFPIEANKTAVTGDNLLRLSLGLQAILQTKKIILLINGSEKLAVYREALIATHNKYPISNVLQQNTVAVDVYWTE